MRAHVELLWGSSTRTRAGFKRARVLWPMPMAEYVIGGGGFGDDELDAPAVWWKGAGQTRSIRTKSNKIWNQRA